MSWTRADLFQGFFESKSTRARIELETGQAHNFTVNPNLCVDLLPFALLRIKDGLQYRKYSTGADLETPRGIF
eukprot:1366270-Rhodomonas_salina.5